MQCEALLDAGLTVNSVHVAAMILRPASMAGANPLVQSALLSMSSCSGLQSWDWSQCIEHQHQSDTGKIRFLGPGSTTAHAWYLMYLDALKAQHVADC